MPRETNAAKRERAIEVCERLNRRYGPVECFLDHENPFRLLIAVLLSAQTTDAQVNKVTPRLFVQWPTPEAMAGASVADVAETIKSLGFYKSKAKHAVEAAQMIVADEYRAQRGVWHRGGHRGGYTRQPHCAPPDAEPQDARQGAAQDRARSAQDLAARVLGVGQPPVDHLWPRDLRRPQTQVRRVPAGRPLSQRTGGAIAFCKLFCKKVSNLRYSLVAQPI